MSQTELHNRRRWSIAALMVAGLLGMASAASRGDDPVAIEGATLVNNDPIATSRLLDKAYKKESEGFRLTPPAGSRVVERQGIDLLSFVVDAKRWGGNLQLITVQKPIPLHDFVEDTKNEIMKSQLFRAVQPQDEKYLEKEGRKAARIGFTMEGEIGAQVAGDAGKTQGARPAPGKSERISLLRQQFIVQTKENQFMVLTLYAPLSDRDLATRTFDAMLGQFEIFDAAKVKERRVEAVKVGKKWLAARSAEEFKDKIINQPQIFRMLVGAEDVGYMEFDEWTQEPNDKGTGLVDVMRDGRKGVLIKVSYRQFPRDGSLGLGGNEAFLSFSHDAGGQVMPHYSSWNNESKAKAKVPIPVSKQRPGMPTFEEVEPWQRETGLLTQDLKGKYTLNVSMSGDKSQWLPNDTNLPIPLGTEEAPSPQPLPKLFEYCWTRFVDLTKPSEMSFVVFDSVTKKPALRNLIVTGKSENVVINGKSVNCFKCIDEVDPNSTTIWVNPQGRIQMMRTSDQSVLEPTTEQEMQAKWQARLKG